MTFEGEDDFYEVTWEDHGVTIERSDSRDGYPIEGIFIPEEDRETVAEAIAAGGRESDQE